MAITKQNGTKYFDWIVLQMLILIITTLILMIETYSHNNEKKNPIYLKRISSSNTWVIKSKIVKNDS